MITLPVPTADGEFVAHYSERGLARLDFPQANPLKSPPADVIPSSVWQWHALTVRALKQILAGREPKTLPPLDLTSGTEFRQRVWRAMRQISLGKTSSYGELAAAIGQPAAARAVGGACGANPVPVLVPCHRVLASQQRLGGFGGGLDWKRKLLQRENIIFIE